MLERAQLRARRCGGRWRRTRRTPELCEGAPRRPIRQHYTPLLRRVLRERRAARGPRGGVRSSEAIAQTGGWATMFDHTRNSGVTTCSNLLQNLILWQHVCAPRHPDTAGRGRAVGSCQGCVRTRVPAVARTDRPRSRLSSPSPYATVLYHYGCKRWVSGQGAGKSRACHQRTAARALQ